ncbi:hypothetical protein NMU03_10715 [Allocoprobacillus halotolerans]|uniref:Uncharacterized protein n=1 Tax=Allocoprobacillus halotolerans TaxID=2944914 RepID=A0ABY5I258_9FIRM|nr:hypothetical protein [Allocoprobacillus halotolerans]UTY38158.1 hypothetical protein NMU03_10715 [Allocoprobacillus halotolerans]
MKNTDLEIQDIAYVHIVTIGSINPNHPLSDQERQKQVDHLNRCLNESPKGRIIAFDRSVGQFAVGQHEFIMEKITYHVGFKRKPYWIK